MPEDFANAPLILRLAGLAVHFLMLFGCYNLIHPLPASVSYEGPLRTAPTVRFLADLTWVDEEGNRHIEQNIYNAVFEIIHNAERYIVVDMFLYNDFQGPVPETTRGLSGELTEALIARKRGHPDMSIVVISDPVNTVYGGLRSKHFDALVEAGIAVVITKLDRLRDSNPSYSTFWRILAKPWEPLAQVYCRVHLAKKIRYPC